MEASVLLSTASATSMVEYLRGGASMSFLPRMLGRPPPPPKLTWQQKLGKTWYKVPHPLRYFVSGNTGNLLFYITERVLFAALDHVHLPTHVRPYQDSITFLAGYLIHIVGQHYVHALLVYGLDTIDTSTKYWRTLRGLYSALITSAMGSTLVNAWLLQWGMKKTAAFITTLWIFACINYAWINAIVYRSTRKALEEAKAKKRKPRRHTSR
jgi:hypothetical protein